MIIGHDCQGNPLRTGDLVLIVGDDSGFFDRIVAVSHGIRSGSMVTIAAPWDHNSVVVAEVPEYSIYTHCLLKITPEDGEEVKEREKIEETI